ncbi:helix-turn-helix domain-containing protein [Streptomyces gobiensis]|uniref:helix-turn-helix domain-containing protein n=1 Tax=Streptomyces gobiensis TaxID=2875706 RepID=UPI001E3098AD|nr:helix-turn-helix transcriptional regulator [Streptomyces gobiensis]UGY93714.1 helix-turn-helix domain-containing protein [Streptomyces gobiensis]
MPQWSDYTTGERVRFLRGQEMTQQGLANATGLSLSLIQKVEQTSKASIGSLLRLASALKVDISVILGQQGPRHAMTMTDRAALRHIESAVHNSALKLFPDGMVPSDIPSLRAALGKASLHYWKGEHVETASILPQLMMETTALADSGSGSERDEAMRILADAYRIAARVGNSLGSRNLSYAAMTHAKTSAERASDELLYAAQNTTLAWVLMRDGRLADAISLSLGAASQIEPSFSQNDQARLAVYGKLMIRAAVASSRLEDKERARDYLSQAHAAAARVDGEIDPYETTFGQATAGTEAVTVALALGEIGKAIKLIKSTQGVDQLRDVPRLRYMLSVALAQAEAKLWDRAADTLLAVIAERPEWARHQALVGVVNQRIADHATHKARQISRTIGVPLALR